MESRRGRIAAAAAAPFLSGAPLAASAKETAKVHCEGVNSCKGKSACNSAHNRCRGQNSCKGKGWLEMTKRNARPRAARSRRVGDGPEIDESRARRRAPFRADTAPGGRLRAVIAAEPWSWL